MKGMRRYFLPAIIILAILFLFFFANRMFLEIDPGFIQNWILSWGWWAPFVFFLMFICRPFTLFPSSLLALAGGLAFGVREGFIFTYIGSLFGALLSFWVARKLGRSYVKRKWPDYSDKIQNQIEKRGFFYLFLLRLVPFLGFDMVSYMAALSNIRFSTYLFATVFGILPGAFAYTFLGGSVATGEFQMFMIAAVVLMIVIAVPIIWLRKKGK